MRIENFFGVSANALQIQIWTSLIAMLLLKYLQRRSRFGWRLSTLAALLGQQLFVYGDLWLWLDEPGYGSMSSFNRGHCSPPTPNKSRSSPQFIGKAEIPTSSRRRNSQTENTAVSPLAAASLSTNLDSSDLFGSIWLLHSWNWTLFA